MRIKQNIEQACAALQQPGGMPANHIPLFHLFLFLQVLDLLTTLVILKLGGYEMNPMVKYLMQFGTVGGLVLAKAIVVAMGAATVWLNRRRVVFLASYAYAGVVCWNLTVLAIH